jgi:hypothetical protein
MFPDLSYIQCSKDLQHLVSKVYKANATAPIVDEATKLSSDRSDSWQTQVTGCQIPSGRASSDPSLLRMWVSSK